MRKVKIVSVVCLEIAYLFAVGLVLIANVPIGKANDKLKVNGTVVPTVTYYYDDGVTVLWQTDQPLTDKPTDDAAFISRVATILRAKYGETFFDSGRWEVITTLNKPLQDLAKTELLKASDAIKNDGGIGAVFLAEDIETAGVVSFVSTYANDQLTVELGSLMKPITIATAIDVTDKYGAGSKISDTKMPLDGWPCVSQDSSDCLKDYDLRNIGDITVRYALGMTRNIPVVAMSQTAGRDKVVAVAESLGLNNLGCVDQTKDCLEYPASMLGDGLYAPAEEVVGAFAGLARAGNVRPQNLIKEVKENGVNKQLETSDSVQALRSDTTYIINDILSDKNSNYLGIQYASSFSSQEQTFALSGGIVNNRRTTGMIGYSPRYVAGIWYGNNERELKSLTPESIKIPIWYEWMKQAHVGQVAKNFEKPTTVQQLPAYVIPSWPGAYSPTGIPSSKTDIYPSWYR